MYFLPSYCEVTCGFDLMAARVLCGRPFSCIKKAPGGAVPSWQVLRCGCRLGAGCELDLFFFTIVPDPYIPYEPKVLSPFLSLD